MLVTAASELTRNTLIHGGGGKFSWKWSEKDGYKGSGQALRMKDPA
jgi:serine/threonine-protein kinase RsbT